MLRALMFKNVSNPYQAEAAATWHFLLFFDGRQGALNFYVLARDLARQYFGRDV